MLVERSQRSLACEARDNVLANKGPLQDNKAFHRVRALIPQGNEADDTRRSVRNGVLRHTAV